MPGGGQVVGCGRCGEEERVDAGAVRGVRWCDGGGKAGGSVGLVKGSVRARSDRGGEVGGELGDEYCGAGRGDEVFGC